MQAKRIRVRAKLMFLVILANFLAQVPYFFHNYFGIQSLAISLRSFLILGSVFAFFLIASFLLFKGQRWGYPLMVVFLSVEFLFYLFGSITSIIHGYGPFFLVFNPDPVLAIIFSIGYLNLFASGYFLVLLFRHRDFFQSQLSEPKIAQ